MQISGKRPGQSKNNAAEESGPQLPLVLLRALHTGQVILLPKSGTRIMAM